MILCSGCFDGLHAGHVRYLHLARQVAPIYPLVVAIAHDSYIGETKQRQTLWNQAERGETVAAVRDVDRVILQGPGSVASVILAERPAIVVKGSDWRNRLPSDVVAASAAVGARIVFVEADLRDGHVEDVLERYYRGRCALKIPPDLWCSE